MAPEFTQNFPLETIQLCQVIFQIPLIFYIKVIFLLVFIPLLQIDIFQSTFDSQINIICSKSITLHNPHIIHSYILMFALICVW